MRFVNGLSGAFLAAAVVTGAPLFVSAAQADTLDFTFTIDNTFYVPGNGFPSGVAGEVIGDITLQEVSGTSYKATAVDITYIVPGGAGTLGPFTLDPSESNVFKVTGGDVISNAELIGYSGTYEELGINWSLLAGGFAYWQSAGGCDASDPVTDGCSVVGAGPEANGQPQPYGTLAFVLNTSAPSTTPLPATLPLFASGLGALGLLGWRRKRKAQATA